MVFAQDNADGAGMEGKGRGNDVALGQYAPMVPQEAPCLFHGSAEDHGRGHAGGGAPQGDSALTIRPAAIVHAQIGGKTATDLDDHFLVTNVRGHHLRVGQDLVAYPETEPLGLGSRATVPGLQSHGLTVGQDKLLFPSSLEAQQFRRGHFLATIDTA